MSVVIEGNKNQNKQPSGSLFNPWIDFLCLGGGYLVLIPIIYLFLPTSEIFVIQISFAFMIVGNFINHPHFAHSYHIFYRAFKEKVTQEGSSLRYRYIFAGIGVPVLLFLFFTYCMVFSEFQLLGLAGNIMAFFVGWHYVKQGYGILIVTSVLKRSFFSDNEKKVFFVNAYIVWIYSWIKSNIIISEIELWGIKYYTFGVPEWLNWVALTCLLFTSTIAIGVMVRKLLQSVSSFPKNVAVAYFSALYAWLLLLNIHPILVFIVPAFHNCNI
ncbi:MAG: hypothetical protein P8J14_02640 [Emcibacteraceae bacterium]|nr:hypothetical protein [Emcibacteraceae bacterium]